jgi:hypothetical protein
MCMFLPISHVAYDALRALHRIIAILGKAENGIVRSKMKCTFREV